jgi:hypothetical protein
VTRGIERTLSLFSIFVLSSNAPAQNCQPFWAGLSYPAANARNVAVFDDGGGSKLYASGSFAGPFGTGWPGVSRWNGQAWEVLTEGWPALALQWGPNSPYLLKLDFGAGERMCAMVTTGSNQWHLAVWNGTQWQPGPPGMIAAAASPRLSIGSGPEAVIYGASGQLPAGNYGVVRWTDSKWEFAGASNDFVQIMAVYDWGHGPQLIAAGYFTTIGGVQANRIARYDGNAWHPLGSGICSGGSFTPSDMVVHDDGTGPKLYITDVTCAGGQQVNRIARWDGATSTWSDVGGGGITPVGPVGVHCLGSFDDGSGPALYAGGYISMAGGVPVSALARYDGEQWDDVMGGVGGGIPLDFAVFDDGRGPSLFVAGEFNRAGAGSPGSTKGIAQIVGCPSCYANCDNSQTTPRLNIADFSCFLQKYAGGDPYVDCNQDRAVNIADFTCFLQKFAAGCSR